MTAAFGNYAAGSSWPQVLGQQHASVYGWQPMADPLSAFQQLQLQQQLQQQQFLQLQQFQQLQMQQLEQQLRPNTANATGIYDPLVMELASQLGLDTGELEHFAWIAEYGLQDDVLPVRWTRLQDALSGSTYYIDSETQISTWEHPLLPTFRRIVDCGRLYLLQPSEDFFEDQKVILWQQLKSDLDCWYGPHESPDGRLYYANSQTGESSWSDPRVETQWIFELESGLIDALQEMLPTVSELRIPGFGCQDLPGEYRRTDSGAEVLSLESPGTMQTHMIHKVAWSRLSKVARQESEIERTDTLKNMIAAVEWINEVYDAEAEAQRSQLKKRVRARQCRAIVKSGLLTHSLPQKARSDSTSAIGPPRPPDTRPTESSECDVPVLKPPPSPSVKRSKFSRGGSLETLDA